MTKSYVNASWCNLGYRWMVKSFCTWLFCIYGLEWFNWLQRICLCLPYGKNSRTRLHGGLKSKGGITVLHGLHTNQRLGHVQGYDCSVDLLPLNRRRRTNVSRHTDSILFKNLQMLTVYLALCPSSISRTSTELITHSLLTPREAQIERGEIICLRS